MLAQVARTYGGEAPDGARVVDAYEGDGKTARTYRVVFVSAEHAISRPASCELASKVCARAASDLGLVPRSYADLRPDAESVLEERRPSEAEVPVDEDPLADLPDLI